MKRKTMFCMLSLCLMSAVSVNAQVTIGGLVLSNVTLTDLSSIPGEISKATAINGDADKKAALKGAIVFNMGVSNKAGSNIPAGIYIWNGYCWTPDGRCVSIVTPSSRAFTVGPSTGYADLTLTSSASMMAFGTPKTASRILQYTYYQIIQNSAVASIMSFLLVYNNQ
jgi:hypothetical protein